MSSNFKTPGVYIVEKEAFPNSIVQVATAVPCFIGYTEKAPKNRPFRITSFAEYQQYFGGPPRLMFSINPVDTGGEIAINGKEYDLAYASTNYLLYRSMLFFYQNGGGPCYIASVGDYTTQPVADAFTGVLKGLEKEPEITMVLAPDALLLAEDDYYTVARAMLEHCDKTQSRITILDIYDGYKPVDSGVVDNFRNNIGTGCLKYGAAYYPFLNTSIENTVSYTQISNADLLDKLVQQDTGKSLVDIGKGGDESQANQALTAVWPGWKLMKGQMLQKINLLPPAPAMAGIYTMVDNNLGVWKAPANVSVSSVISTAAYITHDMQEDLNVPLNGKAINAMRTFVGKGVLVWGARTLDANSQEWRYINVRRTMIMLEQSVKAAAKAYVFEPNDANTWVSIKGMITNFLTGVWKQGGLAGATPEDAFSVNVGLGNTMTPVDILDGIMRVTVMVAIVRPSEFIEITFQQQMQKS